MSRPTGSLTRYADRSVAQGAQCVDLAVAVEAVVLRPAVAVLRDGAPSAWRLLVNVLEGGASVQVSVSLGAQTLQATIVTG